MIIQMRECFFVTICSFNRAALFGEIENGKMLLNELGQIVDNEWLKTEKIRKNVKMDNYIIMPNHFHGIINIRWGTARRAHTKEQFGKPVAGSLPTIIRSFKSAVTKRINEIRNTQGQHVWQRNYYEHIIRDEFDLYRIREYIISNALNWDKDEYF